MGNALGVLYVYITLQGQLISQDPLTKLNNRNQLYQSLYNLMHRTRSNKSVYLLIMDVDHFKSINDQYGHLEGDKALKRVANTLLKVFDKRSDTVFRFGGDEFVVLCEFENYESFTLIHKRIHDILAQYGTPYKLTISIGIARYTDDIKTQQEFIDRADQELYKVKKSRIA